MNLATHLAKTRREMLSQHLRGRGITDQRVLDAMARVPREAYVSVDQLSDAYADRALCIDCGQTISQPYIVALMTQALDLEGTEHVLEVGTGSGYQTAVLAELAREVVSIERHPELVRQAALVLSRLGYVNIRTIIGDGSLGWPPEAPYDRIIVTAAASACPPELLTQLGPRGILVGPFGPADSQVLERISRQEDGFHKTPLVPCRFVPLIMRSGDQTQAGR